MPAFTMDRVLEYVSHHPWLATATAVVVALIAVYEMRARSESLVSVTPQELIRLMNQGALLLDLRAPEQYQAGHLAGARQMSGEQILKAADTLFYLMKQPPPIYTLFPYTALFRSGAVFLFLHAGIHRARH